jgi:hypothetical protein
VGGARRSAVRRAGALARSWIGEALALASGSVYGDDGDLADRVALRLRIAPNTQRSWRSLTEAYEGALVSARTDELLRVVNTILQLTNRPIQPHLDQLEAILDNGGSPFTVDRREWQPQLVRRVDATEQAATDQAVSDVNGDASKHLAEAWNDAFGLDPDPDNAYARAVKAVEDVAIPIMCPPTASNPTLGTVLSTLRGQATAGTRRWQLVLPDQQNNPAPVKTLEMMVELLWHGQRSRHAGSASSRSNTLEEAQAAVRLAVLLVSWFTTGAVQKLP